jgi:NTE family protein
MHRNRILGGLGRFAMAFLASALLGACASYGVVKNVPVPATSDKPQYTLKTYAALSANSDIGFILNFSGGGTRAAAMAYGVLQELRDTPININGQQKRMLDEVDQISSVSGGSFTAAYYGLNGDGIFDTFEEAFLRRNVQDHMKWSLLTPTNWFGSKGRTQRAIEYYQEILFHDATFADMLHPGRPLIVINASDLASGVRFSFLQGYFDLLCSDLLTFPVANAVAASSAVPVVFNPVVLENYPDCPGHELVIPPAVLEQAKTDPELAMLFDGVKTYSDKENSRYVFLVDGGITDNLGLRAMTDVITVSGGPGALLNKVQKKPPGTVVFISVNASTEQVSELGKTNKQPSILQAVNSMSDVQLHRYNAATVALLQNQLASWAAAISTPEQPVTPYFIQVTFEAVQQQQLKLFLNKIPTSFNLTDEQVDTLIDSARTLLRENPDFQKLISEINTP